MLLNEDPSPAYVIRPVDLSDDREVNTIASFSMLTILETLPESRLDPTIVPNLSIASMGEMYRSDLGRSDRNYLVAVDAEGNITGHAIAVLRTDDSGLPYGYSYTRYVLPAHRKQGIARQLLHAAKRWWWEQGVLYVLAHTHPTNLPLQRLFVSEGFIIDGEEDGKWPMVRLRWASGG
ncbi:MAG: GNAT family N-acetyltransferase [Myxococcota bacterium]|nr:GNAT family N-acetyltransferase [Myxococcota bacterium]